MTNVKECVFCNIDKNFSDKQILYTGQYFYLVVPKGQIIEGYLIISPYKCDIAEGGVRSLSSANPQIFDELKSIINLVAEFYKHAYNIDKFSYYEQGRGGAGNDIDDLNNFSIHSHVCTLPSEYNFSDYMNGNYKEIKLEKIENIQNINVNYLLLGFNDQIYAYIGRNQEQDNELSHFRFKKIIALLLDCKDREQWRMCEKSDKVYIKNIIRKFKSFTKEKTILKNK